jgi:dihydrofolate reductase
MATQYYTASTLDGFIADTGHTLDWLLQFGSVDETSYPEFIRDVGALAMGSTTYEWVVRHLAEPEAGGEVRTWPYTQPTWVFTSRSLSAVPGADIRFVKGDVRAVHDEMVAIAGGKNVWIVGGGELVGKFHDEGLLDELIVQIAPVTLGAGTPLLPRAITTPPLRLISVATYGDTFVEVRYAVPRAQSDL